RHQCLDVLDAVVNDPNRAGGEPAVAAGFVLRRRFQHEHRGALFLGRQRRAEGCVAAAHDNDIRIQLRHSKPQSIAVIPGRNNADYSAAAADTPPWAFDQPAGSCMNFSTSASLSASNLPPALATANTSHQVASECSVTPRSLMICRASG